MDKERARQRGKTSHKNYWRIQSCLLWQLFYVESCNSSMAWENRWKWSLKKDKTKIIRLYLFKKKAMWTEPPLVCNIYSIQKSKDNPMQGNQGLGRNLSTINKFVYMEKWQSFQERPQEVLIDAFLLNVAVVWWMKE